MVKAAPTPEPRVLRVLGLMSGTSLDGVDAASIETDGLDCVIRGPALTLPYPEPFRQRLRGILGSSEPDAEIRAVERELTARHAEAAEALIAAAGGIRPDLVGFHGHTICHDPAGRRTWQIGDGMALAKRLGIPVVSDFRSRDVAAGGEGAPLVPVYHRAFAAALPRPLAVLNLGGVGNVTWIGPDERLIAFDTGPGTALIDDWMLTRAGLPFDRDGAAAQGGTPDMGAIAAFLDHAYFARPVPKSLDRNAFAGLTPDRLGLADGAATLVEFTAAAVEAGLAHLPARPLRWLVTGGGRHNRTLMAALARRLGVPVEPVEAVGWDGNSMEAEAFAYLARRAIAGHPISFPDTTGVPRPLTGGTLHRPG